MSGRHAAQRRVTSEPFFGAATAAGPASTTGRRRRSKRESREQPDLLAIHRDRGGAGHLGLFPVSSLGHAVLIPALVGGSWAKNLDVASTTSPYLAVIVGLHLATALALLVFYWRDWVTLLRGAATSIRHRRISSGPERLFWLIVAATIPVAIAGLIFDKLLRTTLGKPLPAAIFLMINGVVLLVGQRLARRGTSSRSAEGDPAARPAAVPAGAVAQGATVTDQRIATLPFPRGIGIGAAQIFALLPGISRSGSTMVAGQQAGLTNQEAARFSFLLATPAILGAAVLKLPDLFGPLGHGILGPVLAGSAVAFVCALGAVAFLDRYFARRSLLPFAIYCIVAGAACAIVFLTR